VTPFGLVVGAVVVATLFVLGPLLLPSRGPEGLAQSGQDTIFLTELRIGEDFDGIGTQIKNIAALKRGSVERGSLELVAVREEGQLRRDALAEHEIDIGSTLIARTDMAELLTLKDTRGIIVGAQHTRSAVSDDPKKIVAQAMIKLSRVGWKKRSGHCR
jgi:hypothetical protein